MTTRNDETFDTEVDLTGGRQRDASRDRDTEEIEVVDTEPGDGSLLPDRVANDYRSRWESIQGAFVDEPRMAVTDADGLVVEVMDRLRASFEDQRQDLEAGWDDDEVDSSTEDLRVAFRRYRAFFERLLQT